MKRFVLLLLLLTVLLVGCGNEPAETTVTEPTLSWVEANGQPWDDEGAVTEIQLTIPGGLQYTSVAEFDGDLLLWSADFHLEDQVVMEMCLLDLDSGAVIAQNEISFPQYMMVQAMGDRLYLCHSEVKEIYVLDKSLEIVETLKADFEIGSWYMGGNGMLYVYDWYGGFFACDLSTGTQNPVVEGDPYIDYVGVEDGFAEFQFYNAETGAPMYGVLDLSTGDVSILDEAGDFFSTHHTGNHWLYGTYDDYYSWYIKEDGKEPLKIQCDNGNLRLIDGDRILYVSDEVDEMHLYDIQGNSIAKCRISWMEYHYSYTDLIWNEQFGGYFVLLSGYAGDQRLLFWDISRSEPGENMIFEPIPAPSEAEAFLKQRALELGKKYGVIIYVGNDCKTQFDEFSATRISNYEQVNRALDVLDEALSKYPEGFFRQLRYGDIHNIQIHLITDLMADGSGRYGDGYVAFAQNMWDYYLIVVDIEDADCQTYYHEFSHVIDSFLAWDADMRDNALFSEDGWNYYNPAWFRGYSYDYSVEHELVNDDYFVDGYSTISPTEDRARVMEYAMADYGFYTFEDNRGIQMKLEYYCRCIRDAFDTTGWPEELPWEQYLD